MVSSVRVLALPLALTPARCLHDRRRPVRAAPFIVRHSAAVHTFQ